MSSYYIVGWLGLIDTIALWIGYIFLGSIVLFGLSFVWYYIIRNTFQMRIECKAIGYAIASNMRLYRKNKNITTQTTMSVGREWYIHYNGKNYLWKCIGVEDKV